MNRLTMFTLFYMASFFQAGAYGLTFMLPRLFVAFGANEKVVGIMLFVTTISTLISVYFSGHLSDRFGRVFTLGVACFSIAISLTLYGMADGVGILLTSASILLGFGWGLTYSLSPIVLTRLVSMQERVRYFALLSVALMAGFGLSPVLASLVEKAGYAISYAFFFTAILCAIAGLIFFCLVLAVQAHAAGLGPEKRSNLSVTNIASIMRSSARLPIIMVFLGASVFAGMNNFQTVFADERGLDYANFFLVYTITVVIFRVLLARYKGGSNPYLTIAFLQYVMFTSVILFLFIGGSANLYIVVAFLFGLGYGVSYPILAAMAANDADERLLSQTLQFFAFTYFIGIFGFPLIAGWILVELGSGTLLVLTAVLAGIEATMAIKRAMDIRKKQTTSAQSLT